MNRSHVIQRASTWWIASAALHALWIILLTLWLSDSGIDTPLINWVRQHRPPNRGGPDYIVAYGYIINGLASILALGIVTLVVASFLQWRENRLQQRIRRGLCPACAYPVGDSPVCTECGKPVTKQKAEMT